MDLSTVTAALASKSYDKVADICDNLMLQVPIYFTSLVSLCVTASSLGFVFVILMASLNPLLTHSLRLQQMALVTRTTGPTPFIFSLTFM